MAKTPIWLLGMMGAGKSSLGPQLARRLQLTYVDTDRQIEEQAGRSVAQIFVEEGESGFREREYRAVAALRGTPAVVGLGGGAVTLAKTRDVINRYGTRVYLRAGVDCLMRRLGASEGRPLLSGLDEQQRRTRLEDLLAQRESHYRQAEFVLDTEDKPIDVCVEELAGLLRGTTGRNRNEH